MRCGTCTRGLIRGRGERAASGPIDRLKDLDVARMHGTRDDDLGARVPDGVLRD